MCILKTENEKRRKNERSVSLVRFFRALKYVKFCFCVVKSKMIGTIAPFYKCTLFFWAVYICNVHFGGWVSDVLKRSHAERSRSDERSKERERRFTKVSKQSLDLVQC